MKKNKILDKLTVKLAQNSFKGDNLDETKVKLFVKDLSKLSRPLAIYALMSYLKQVKNILKSKTLEIESEEKLDKSQIEIINKTFAKSYKILKVEFLVNPLLLGGVKVRVGDMVYDYSLKNNLDQLKGVIQNG